MAKPALDTESSEAPDDGELIPAAAGGDLRAFEVLVRRHQGAVRAFLVARLASANDAEDLAQEVFVTAFRKLRDFESGRSFGAWLRGIAQNLLRNHLRKFRATPVGGNEELQAMLDQRLEAGVGGQREAEVLVALEACLDELDGPSREIVSARYVDGETVRELQRRTGRGYSALTMQLHRIRCTLARCVEGKTGALGEVAG